MKKFLFFFSTWVLLTVSCTKLIRVDLPEVKNKTVLMSLLKAGDTIKVYVTRVQNIHEFQPADTISNATVKLYEDGQWVETLSFDGVSGFYVSTQTAQTGKTYKITCSVPGNAMASGETTVPSPPPIHTVSAVPWNHFVDPESTYPYGVKITFEIQDPPGEDFYAISAFYKENTSSWHAYYYELYPELPAVPDPALDELVNYGVFSDDYFDGSTYRMSLVYGYDRYNATGNRDTILLQYCHVTRDYYRFYISRYFNESYDDLFAVDPENIYTNVTNGYGLVAAYAEKIDTVSIQR